MHAVICFEQSVCLPFSAGCLNKPFTCNGLQLFVGFSGMLFQGFMTEFLRYEC